MPARLDYTVTLTRPDGAVVTTIIIPVLQESATAGGNASSRLDFTGTFSERTNAERGLRSDLRGLEHTACADANDRAIEAAINATQGN